MELGLNEERLLLATPEDRLAPFCQRHKIAPYRMFGAAVARSVIARLGEPFRFVVGQVRSDHPRRQLAHERKLVRPLALDSEAVSPGRELATGCDDMSFESVRLPDRARHGEPVREVDLQADKVRKASLFNETRSFVFPAGRISWRTAFLDMPLQPRTAFGTLGSDLVRQLLRRSRSATVMDPLAGG